MEKGCRMPRRRCKVMQGASMTMAADEYPTEAE